MTEIVYNELSSEPLSENNAVADIRVIRFIKTFKRSTRHGFKKIRFSKEHHEIEIYNVLSITGWLATSNQKTLKDILLGSITRPFINPVEKRAEDQYHTKKLRKQNKNGK